MNNEVLNDIKEYAKKRLMAAYDYCGVAENDDFALLNSDDGNGKDLEIRITIKAEDK